MCALITLCLLATPALADVAGVASVIDGDTIEVHGQRIRIHGIDAPESRQLCRLDAKKTLREICTGPSCYRDAVLCPEHADQRVDHGDLGLVITNFGFDIEILARFGATIEQKIIR